MAVEYWRLRSTAMDFSRGPRVMGIVNVTPDSFSDGGKFRHHPAAIEHALRLDADGADLLDVGGESTRPYSDPVGADEEMNRVIPVISELARRTATPISINTSKASVAAEAIRAGAEIINDVTGLTGDPDMLAVACRYAPGICAMHMQGTPQTMQDAPRYDNVTSEIYDYLQMRKKALQEAGIAPCRICLDPGIGFGKTHQHNLQLINECKQFLKLDCPILIGHSRKGFLGKIVGDQESDRDVATLAVSLRLAQQGMHVLRVHNVRATVEGLKAFVAVGGLQDV